MWLESIERQNYAAASIQATLYNAHFDCKGVPWTAEDLLGRGDREKRTKDALHSKMVTSRIMEKSNSVPDWALDIAAGQGKKAMVN